MPISRSNPSGYTTAPTPYQFHEYSRGYWVSTAAAMVARL